MEKLEALAKFLNCEQSEIANIDDCTFEHGKEEYLVLTDEEADEKSNEEIKNLLWTFKASFILEQCDLPYELEDGLQAAQEKQCESANDWIERLVEKTCGLDSFVQSAISADGRGHFLNSYDGSENEQDDYFIYRTN